MVCARLVLLACLGCFAWGCGGAQHPDDETSSADDAPHHKKHRKKKKKKVAHVHRDEDEDAPKPRKRPTHDDSEDEDAPRKPKAAAKHGDDDDAPKKRAAKHTADDDDDAPKKSARKKPAAADDEDDAPKKPARKVTSKKAADDEDEAAPKKPAAKPSTDDDDTPKITDDDDEPAEKPKATAVKRKAKPTRPAAKAKVVAKPNHDDDKPREPTPEEPPKKQRTIEEDVAIDDPLATAPPRAVASADEANEEATDSATAEAVAVTVAPPKGETLQDRALTTPEGQIDLHGGLPINVLTVTDTTGMATSSTSEGLALGVAYGFNAKTEVGFDYTIGLSPGTIKGPATLHGAYSLAHGKLDFAAAAALGIDFYDTVDSVTMTTSSQTAASLQLGAWVRYHATPTLSIFSGLPGTPNASASLSRLAFALPVLSYQVQIGLGDRGATSITLPIGLGYQASPKLYAFASVNLANIRIANTSNAFLFKDYIPIAVGGFYSFDTVSLGASLADDLKQGFGYLRFELVARYLLH
jgi:hypothetical protein